MYLPSTQAPPRGSNTALSSSTTKETSPPRRNTAEIIRVSATRPGIMFHVLGVDEDLKGSAMAVDDGVVDREIDARARCLAISACRSRLPAIAGVPAARTYR